MPQLNDLGTFGVPFEHDRPLVAVIEMSQSSWLVAGMIPWNELPSAEKARG